MHITKLYIPGKQLKSTQFLAHWHIPFSCFEHGTFKDIYPAVIQKELQQATEVAYYKRVTGKSSMKKKDIEKYINELFFGNNKVDNIFQIKQLVNDEGQYKTLYYKETI